MSVKDAGKTIREARLKSGLTQEQLSDGICSPLSLSRIETGAAGVSPSTFRALMTRTGIPSEVFPVFENWNDFKCFFYLQHARFHLDAWQLDCACAELDQVEKTSWNNNKFYYQEWLLLHGKLQFRSGCHNHAGLHDLFLKALQITLPTSVPTDLGNRLLSIPEMELLLNLAQEALYLNHSEEAASSCRQVYAYLQEHNLPRRERNQLLAEYAIVYGKYLIAARNYNAAFRLLDANRHQMVADVNYTPLFELTFLTGLSLFYLEKAPDAWRHFKSVFYSAHAVDSCYATICRDFLRSLPDIQIPENMQALPDIPLHSFPWKEIQDTAAFSDGVFDCYKKGVITIGTLIHRLRTEQKIPQRILCQGLCSTSFLSKIEKGSLQPDIILAEALLQRLGLSDREFTFHGNSHETKLHDCKMELISYHYLPDTASASMLQKMQELLTENDSVLYRQFYLYMKARHTEPTEERMELFQEALAYTLPEFSIDETTKYRLSWMELTILNNIAWTYLDTETPHQSLRYLRRILDYRNAVQPDLILQTYVFSVTLIRLFRVLYRHKYFREMIDIPEQEDISILKYAVDQIGVFHFYYCQALGECGRYEKVSTPALYSCGEETLREYFENKELLQKYLEEDFSLNINY